MCGQETAGSFASQGSFFSRRKRVGRKGRGDERRNEKRLMRKPAAHARGNLLFPRERVSMH